MAHETHRKTAVRSKVDPKESQATQRCPGCKAFSAFQYWREQTLTPSFNWESDFRAW
jgi:hypothetical protein